MPVYRALPMTTPATGPSRPNGGVGIKPRLGSNILGKPMAARPNPSKRPSKLNPRRGAGVTLTGAAAVGAIPKPRAGGSSVQIALKQAAAKKAAAAKGGVSAGRPGPGKISSLQAALKRNALQGNAPRKGL